jgi:hypothetical protein
VAGTPAGDLARRLGIRTGRLIAPGGLLAILAGTVLFLLPPHSALAALVFGILGVAAFGLGMVSFAGGPWWALIVALLSGALLFAGLTVGGRGLALHLFGQSESCLVVRREEVVTSARYPQYGFLHTVECPQGGTFTIRTDSTDRQEPDSRVRVLDDPGGLLEPDFASRHHLAVDLLAVLGAMGVVAATVTFTRRRILLKSAN